MPLIDKTGRALDWRQRGACIDVDPDIFFLPSTRGRKPNGGHAGFVPNDAEAKAVCARCEVRETCLSWALDSGQDAGVWGGLNPDERARFAGRGAS